MLHIEQGGCDFERALRSVYTRQGPGDAKNSSYMLDRRGRELDGRDQQLEVTYGIPYGNTMYGEMSIGRERGVLGELTRLWL